MKISVSVPLSRLMFLLLVLNTFLLYSQTPPAAKKIPKIFKEFGNERIDNYHWMNNRDSAVLRHLELENNYASAVLDATSQLQQKLTEEILNRQAAQLPELPVISNGYIYRHDIPEGQQYPVYFRKKVGDTTEQVIQDFNALAKGHAVLRLQKPVISPDNKLALISIDTKGSNRYKVLVKDLEKNVFLRDTVFNKTYNFPVWAPDSRSFYYVEVDTLTTKASLLKYHKLGEFFVADQLLYHEKDSLLYLYIQPSGDRRFLFVNSYNLATSGVRFVDLNKAPSKVEILRKPEENIIFQVIDNLEDEVLVYTNHSAPNFRVIKSGIAEPHSHSWQEIIPERKQVYLEPYPLLVGNYLVSKQRKEGVPKLNILNLETAENYDLEFGTATGSFEVALPAESRKTDSIRISFSSYSIPGVDYSYNLKSKILKVFRKTYLPGFDPEDYVTKIISVRVRDGEMVPVSMVYNRNKYKQDGKHPMLLETYSWYNFANDPYFKSEMISLLDRGFIFVYPHARGGAEKGPSWWDNGRRMKRMNTFFDVIDCAKYLIAEKYTSSEKLIGSGISAGGTNMGAIINLEPNLFKAVVAEVPWLDVLTDMQNSEVPGIALEYEEEGNPHIPEEYKYMALWSPYDNVKINHYPSVFATAGWNDNNVPYYHAAKWVAKLREHNLSNSPILLKTNLKAGHSGSTGRIEKAKATALKFAFILNSVGIND